MIDLKRFFAGMAAALLAAVSFFPSQVSAVSARSALVMDTTTGRVFYEKNADDQSLIASTTKIMTALVVCEQCNVLDRMRIPKEAVGIEGSSLYLQEGEVLTIQELLYGMMLHSGNDAATALAIYCGGTVEGFVQMMNDKAIRLGLQNTHFANPHGLDAPGHYSTARDLAVLAANAMKNPIFAQTVSTKAIRIGNRSLQNHNKLLWQLPGADGVKTGYTQAAGRILVSSAIRDGRRLVMVTIHDPNDWVDHKTMMEQTFSAYRMMPIVEKGELVATRYVVGGQEEQVSLLADADIDYPLAEGESLRLVIPGSGFVYAPVSAGQGAGVGYLCLGDQPVLKLPLVYGENIPCKTDPAPSLWQRLFGGIHA